MFLFDVDNTLLENDWVHAHLKEHLEQAYGVAARAERSGLWWAVDDRVLIYIHKECELEYVARLYPADHYVLIDDKLPILAAVKKIWGERVTTVFPKQIGRAHV